MPLIHEEDRGKRFGSKIPGRNCFRRRRPTGGFRRERWVQGVGLENAQAQEEKHARIGLYAVVISGKHAAIPVYQVYVTLHRGPPARVKVKVLGLVNARVQAEKHALDCTCCCTWNLPGVCSVASRPFYLLAGTRTVLAALFERSRFSHVFLIPAQK